MDNTTKRRMPSEWEHQSMVQMTWAHENTDWRPYLKEIEKTMVEMAVAIAEHEMLLIVAPDTAHIADMLKNIMSEKQWSNTIFFECETNDTWARDHAFISVIERQHDTSSIQLLDFCFNGWGKKFKAEKDNDINKKLIQTDILKGNYENHLNLVLEGGSIESDGQGTVFTTTNCLMASNRNQPLNKTQLEEELKKRLGAQRIVWLNHGQLIGDDTDGHIDTIVRCAPNDTLLYVQCNDIYDEHFADFNALEHELQQLKTSKGKLYNLLPLPFPKATYDDNGERLPATYANFLIINDAVIVPTYNQPELDALACETIGKAFPERKIIPINSNIIIRQHGSIHCLTMQYFDNYLPL